MAQSVASTVLCMSGRCCAQQRGQIWEVAPCSGHAVHCVKTELRRAVLTCGLDGYYLCHRRLRMLRMVLLSCCSFMAAIPAKSRTSAGTAMTTGSLQAWQRTTYCRCGSQVTSFSSKLVLFMSVFDARRLACSVGLFFLLCVLLVFCHAGMANGREHLR